MTKLTEVFANHTIRIEDDDSLNIANKDIDCEYDPVSNKWSSRYLPYTQYDSLVELARAIARDTVEFVDPQN